MRQGADGWAKRAREPEVCEFELSVSADQEVLWLQVAANSKNNQHKTRSARTSEQILQIKEINNTHNRGQKWWSIAPASRTRRTFLGYNRQKAHARHRSDYRTCCAQKKNAWHVYPLRECLKTQHQNTRRQTTVRCLRGNNTTLYIRARTDTLKKVCRATRHTFRKHACFISDSILFENRTKQAKKTKKTLTDA